VPTTLTVKGFALFVSLMLVLMLSVFACWMMLVSQAHYAASRALFENENARIVSDAAAQSMVQTHNRLQPGFFFDPSRWSQLQLKPYSWNGYTISGSLAAQWNPQQVNLLTLRADKGRYASEIQVPLRQLRLEDFAFFSDSRQIVSTSTLFDGAVFVRSLLGLNRPARFRELVYNEVSPQYNASYRRKTGAFLDFPPLQQLFPPGWNAGGVEIVEKNPLFWQIDQYVLDLDALEISASGNAWRIRYRGITLGDASKLILSFDNRVRIRQSYREIPHLPSGKPEQSLFLYSPSDLTIESSVQALQVAAYSIRFCFVSGNTIRVAPQTSAARIDASLVAFGDMFVDAGNTFPGDAEKASWASEILGSAFLVEPVAKSDLLQALNSNQKILWLRGSTAVGGIFHAAEDLVQLHFEATRKIHAMLPSFSYIEIVEGGGQWL
jgi:hypothetical protein